MRSDKKCQCGAELRSAKSATTHRTILLDAAAVTGAPYGVVQWQAGSWVDKIWPVPVVALNPKRPILPTRYTKHVCPDDQGSRPR
jgi:hypothetical protein